MNTSTVIEIAMSSQQTHLLATRDHSCEAWIRLRIGCAVLLDINRLQVSLNELTQRHEVLRMRFFQGATGYNAGLDQNARHQLSEADFSLDDASLSEEELAPERLWKFSCQRQGEGMQIVLTGHASVTDVRGLSALAKEWLQLYSGLHGEEEPLQYSQYTAWQQEMQAETEATEGQRFWESFPPATSTRPGLAQAANKQDTTQAHFQLQIPASSYAAAQHLVQARSQSLSDFALATWIGLLSQLTPDTPLHFAFQAHGREYEEFEAIQGPFAIQLPFYSAPLTSQHFIELLETTTQQREQMEAQQLYFQASDNLEIGFAFHDLSGLNFPAELSAKIGMVRARSGAALDLNLWAGTSEAGISIDYDPAHWSEAGVKWLAKMYTALWDAVAQHPQNPLHSHSLVSEADRVEIMAQYAQTGEAGPAYQPLLGNIFAEARSEQTALFAAEAWSYQELDAQSTRLAAHLHSEMGVSEGSIVAVLLDRSPEAIVSFLAIWKAGAAFLPLSVTLPPQRLAYILTDAAPTVVILNSDRMFDIRDYSGQLFAPDLQLEMLEAKPEFTPVTNRENAPAYLIYTSGTTGQPKACLQSHGNLSHYLRWADQTYFEVADTSNFPLLTALSFDLTLTSIFLPLLRGGSVTIMDAEAAVEDNIKQAFVSERVNSIKLTPSHIRILDTLDLTQTHIHTVVTGGEALPLAAVATLRRLNPAIRIFNEYGPTETTVGCASWEVPGAPKNISLGRPMAGTRLYVLDENGKICPPGIAGELFISGPGVGLGYLNQDELTASRFPDDQYQSGKMYRSGDLMRYAPDGNLEFLGRMDDQVKIKGHRVETAEVAAHICQYESVHNACVIPWQASPTDHLQLVAYLVGENLPEQSLLQQYLRDFLPEYMIPVHCLPISAIPLTDHGKVDVKALPDPSDLLKGPDDYVEPANKTEILLATTWQEILGAERVGTQDSFFLYGGDSIKAIQVVARLRDSGLYLEVKDLLQTPTIRELASIARWEASPEPVVKAVEGPVTLMPLQADLMQRTPGLAHHFNQAILLSSADRLDATALQKALDLILERHAALRLMLLEDRGQWQQNAGPVVSAKMESHDLHSAAAPRQKIQAITARLQADLDLKEGNLLRAAHFRETSRDQLLLIVHHFAVDAISWRILVEELQVAYERFANGEVPQLPQPQAHFSAYANSLQEYAQAENTEQELPYWLAQEIQPTTGLRTDFQSASNRFSDIASINLKLDIEATTALIQKVPAAYNTQINDVLLTALARCLASWQGIQSVPILMDGHGRNGSFPHPDISRTVGWFTAEYPFMLALPEGNDPGLQLRTIKEALRAVPNHGIGYGALKYLGQDAVRTQFSADFHPEVSFNFLGDMDAGQSESGFSLSNDPVEGNLHPDLEPPVQLAFTAIILKGQFQIAANYNRSAFKPSTIQECLERYLEALNILIAHCVECQDTQLSPSDIDFDGFGIGELDDFLDNL